MNIFEKWDKRMCHFSKCVGHHGASSFPIIPREKIKNNVPKFATTVPQVQARYSYCTRPTRLGASWECVKKSAALTLYQTYFPNKIFAWAKGWLPLKRRSSAFFAYIHFQCAHRCWSQRKLRAQVNPSIVENLCFRKLNEMRSNVYQRCKYDAWIIRRNKIYQNM